MGKIARALSAPMRLWNSIGAEVEKDRRLRLGDGAAWSRFSGRTSAAGKIVTIDSAMQLSAVWACVKLTAQAVSSLPLSIYERRSDTDRIKVDDDDLSDVLTGSPNLDQTPLEFWEGMVAWLLASGNAYAEKVMIGGRLVALQPLPSDQCQPHRDADGVLTYRFSDRGRVEELPRDRVFHLKGFGQSFRSRDMGLSAIAAGVNSLGGAMAAQDAASSTFAQGLRPTGFFLFDQQLNSEQREQARQNLVEPLRGSGTGGVGILEAGVKWQSVSLNPDDAQMLETRRFDIEEICRWFGVPPIIIGHAGQGQTMWGSGVEAILIAWLTLGLDPICDRIEARILKQLIRPAGERRRYAEFNREALMQMDSAAKAHFLSTMVQNGLMDRAEGRAKLNLPPRDGTDQLTAQTNLAPLDRLGGQEPSQQLRQALRAFMSDGENREHS